MSKALLALVAVVAVLAAAGYWWLNRPPGRYKADNSGLYPIKVDGKYGFMDRTGKTVITPQFDDTGRFSEGLAPVRIGTKEGYIDTKGVLVITPQFDDARPFRYGRAVVGLANRFGFVGKDGKFVGTPTFRWMAPFSGDLAAVQNADGQAGFVDRAGKVVMSGKFEKVGAFSAGLAPAAARGKWGFIDTTGNWAINPQFEEARNFADGLAPVFVGGRTGYIDRKGKFVVNPQYDFGGEFYEGFAGVGNSGAFSFIDTKGRVLGDTTFASVSNFNEGLAPVKTDDGWGFIDTLGKMVINPQFDSAEPFQNGLARVTVSGKEAYVTTSGGFVVDPFPGRAVFPAHQVQEIWEGNVGGRSVHFILIREGTKVRGYYRPLSDYPRILSSLKGEVAQDGSFSMSDDIGESWKARFVSASMIKVVRDDAPQALPMRLRLVRDATPEEWQRPPTSSDWNVFLSSFRDAVQRRDFGALAGMMERTFSIVSGTPTDGLARVNWAEVDRTLARGVERLSSSHFGNALRSIVDERPCPDCRSSSELSFIQDQDDQWRWDGRSVQR